MAPRACWNCGYDLSAVPGDICPECGKRWVDLRAAIDRDRAAARRGRFLAAGLVVLALLGCCLGSALMAGRW